MDVASFLVYTRGRPSLQFRGELFHRRPLSIAVLIWLVLAALRLGAGPLHPFVALVGLAGSMALLRLCLGVPMSETPPAQPRLALALVRTVVLMVAMVSVHAFWQWLTFA